MILLAFQIVFWCKTQDIKPDYNVIPEVPSKKSLKISAFGDDEFLYRVYVNRIQNAGDVFAGFVALKYYDYKKLYQWFSLLDGLNSYSHLTPSLAAYVFANTKKESDIRIILKYLREHGNKDINKNWWWIFQAIYLSSNVLQDDDLALELAYELSKNKDKNAPLWTKQIPAFIHAKKGDGCAAFKIIGNIVNEANSKKRKVSAEEMNFMRYFINIRLKKLKNKKFDPKNCK